MPICMCILSATNRTSTEKPFAQRCRTSGPRHENGGNMWNWFSPKGIVFGEGKAASTGLFARQWGRGRALVITGPFLRRSGVVEPVLQSLREAGLLGAVFSDIPSEPTDRHVREALGLFRIFICPEYCGCLSADGTCGKCAGHRQRGFVQAGGLDGPGQLHPVRRRCRSGSCREMQDGVPGGGIQ